MKYLELIAARCCDCWGVFEDVLSLVDVVNKEKNQVIIARRGANTAMSSDIGFSEEVAGVLPSARPCIEERENSYVYDSTC